VRVLRRLSTSTTVISPWTLHGLKVYPFGKFCVARLINRPACLTSAELFRPTIELQLSGDQHYDRMKRSLLQSRSETSSSSMLPSWVRRFVDYSATRKPEDVLREDVQFLGSLHLAASKPHEQQTANEIKQTAARILGRRVKQTINAFISTLKSRLKRHATAELDHRLAQSIELKTNNTWNTLRGELAEELKKFNSSPWDIVGCMLMLRMPDSLLSQDSAPSHKHLACKPESS
jgi:hypothetical protein